MARWYQQIIGNEEIKYDESFVKNKSIRAYELFKKNKYKVSPNQEGDSQTNKNNINK